jgi:hypothetical protein
MTYFLALYCGPTVAGSRLVAVTAEPELVRRFRAALLDETEPEVTTESKDRTATRELEVVRD